MSAQAGKPGAVASPPKGPVIQDWRPEDPLFWESTGKKIAARNLWISIPNLLLAFSVWMVWSMVTVKLNDIGFNFTKDQLFMLTALPPLAGATLRIFYSFMVPVVGGRRWTAITTASLIIPAVWMGFAVQDPSTSYNVFVLIALWCGVGGGNCASRSSTSCTKSLFSSALSAQVTNTLCARAARSSSLLAARLTSFSAMVSMSLDLFLRAGPMMIDGRSSEVRTCVENSASSTHKVYNLSLFASLRVVFFSAWAW